MSHRDLLEPQYSTALPDPKQFLTLLQHSCWASCYYLANAKNLRFCESIELSEEARYIV